MYKLWNQMHWSYYCLFFSILCIWILPTIFPSEVSDQWMHSPTWKNGLFFGTYYQQNLLVVVLQAAKQSLYLSITAIFFSLIIGIILSFLDFLDSTHKFIHILLKIFVYFPRLFFLLIWCIALGLHEPSQLKWNSITYLILGLGISGGIFLSAQTQPEIEKINKSLFVYAAESAGLSKIKIFFRHIMSNCLGFPFAAVKQIRDNLVVLSFLTFIGVVHLQPEDLGAFLCLLYNNPESFYQGWWILFFPCIMLVFLIWIWDTIAKQIYNRLSLKKN